MLKYKVVDYFFNENVQFNLLIKYRHFVQKKNLPFLPTLIRYLIYRLSGCVISPNVKIKPGVVKFAHPVGVVIGDGVCIGSNVVIFQGVTIGAKGSSNRRIKEYPKIEDDVIIYAGAKIIGGVTIGKGSIIGANAVVISDVPSYSLAVGVPAEIRRININED